MMILKILLMDFWTDFMPRGDEVCFFRVTIINYF